MIPLPCSRRDKCKKTNIAQCMLHGTANLLWRFRRFLCGKELSDWCSESRCFGVLVFLFKHSTWRRPTPLRAFATSGCNEVCLKFRMFISC